MSTLTLGTVVHDFFQDYLVQQKGLRQGSVRSYRDTFRLFLPFVAGSVHKPVSRLKLCELSLESVLSFLRHMEQVRHNSVTTRNQRLAALRTFFDYLGRRSPESLLICEQVAAIPTKRTALPPTRFIAREEVQSLFARLPDIGRLALRDRVLLLFLYNTGARVQEVADLKVGQLSLERPPSVRLLGKGGKWRACPLWKETAEQLTHLLSRRLSSEDAPVFVSSSGLPLTRFGIYKRVRFLTAKVRTTGGGEAAHVSPHIWRHTAAVHLLEAGVDINVIRGWLGHVSIDTTHRYAEITMRMKMDTMKVCAPTASSTAAPWADDPSLLSWLSSL